MDIILGTVLFFLAIFALGGTFLYMGFRSLKLKKLVQKTPTSKIWDLKSGVVEVSGKAIPIKKEYTIKAPFSQKDCVYFRYDVDEWQSSGKSGHWRTIKSGASDKRFFLEDDTGKVLVDAAEAKIEISRSYYFTSGILNRLPKHAEDFLDSISVKQKTIIGLRKSLRISEYLIEPDKQLYIIGEAGENLADDGNDAKDKTLIRKGTGDYYISDQPEDKILRKLTLNAAGCLFLGSALIILSVVVSLLIALKP